jgi:hypothetical protein
VVILILKTTNFDDEDLSIKQFGAGASFLQTLDKKGISRCVFPFIITANVNAHSELGVSGSWTGCVAWTGPHGRSVGC